MNHVFNLTAEEAEIQRLMKEQVRIFYLMIHPAEKWFFKKEM